MNITGRIIKIKKTKRNIFITIKNTREIQLVVKENLYYLCNNLVIGDVISCDIEADANNNGKYKCVIDTYKLVNLKIVSKNNLNYHIDYNYNDLKEYSDAKYRVRNLLHENDYIEVVLPILTDGETSSKATSFETKYSKTDKKLFLRKTMDIFLRLYSCNDLNKIYSIGPCFRNEYVTSTNISEFEMLSIFTNYMTQKDAIDLAVSIIKKILNDDKLIFKYITIDDYNKEHENNIFYVITSFGNLNNSYSDVKEDGTTDEFKIKYNDVTIIHGLMEIKNIEDYLKKIEIQGKKNNYGELQRLEDSLNSGAPICYNLGISIIRILSVFNNKKINDYDIFAFNRLNLKNKGEKYE